MINRVLIRVKVVQMLYSYLLTRNEFKIDEAPESASRDRRYAYSAYIDLLLLLLALSGYPVKAGMKSTLTAVDSRLAENKVAKALAANDAIRTAILRDNGYIGAFDKILLPIHDKIVNSSVFIDYTRKGRRTELSDDVILWITVIETIIARDPAVEEALRTNPNFTVVGFQAAIKAVCDTLRSYNDSHQLLLKAKADLDTSLTQAYDLYVSLLNLILELTDALEERQENAKSKYITTSDDLNPNTRLVDNALVGYLRSSEDFAAHVKDIKVDLISPTSNLLKTLLDSILASDIYDKYINADVYDFSSDVEFWREVMRTIILPSDALAEEMEDRSVFWNDDINIMGTFVLKTLRKIQQSEGKHVDLLPKYKDEEDEIFGRDLFMAAVRNYEDYRKYIDMFIDSKHWDPERIAYMDIVIMVTAIAEIIKYPAIPLAVSINEYVELANNYSTEKSGGFVNGILFSVSNYLKEQGIIHK